MSKTIYQKIERGEVSICQTCIHRFVCRAVDNQPCTECNHYQNAADVAQVRHGRWIDLNIENSTGPMLKCSECSHIHNPNRHDLALERVELKPLYCETCGALMDGKKPTTCHDGVCEIPGVEREEADHA